MNILVTGAAGFLGRNLVENLKNIRDRKNRTRPKLYIHDIYEFDKEDTLGQLERYCQSADFIIHCAGVNRPKDPVEFMSGNFGFTGTLLDTLKKCGNKAPIIITSSVQASLAGRFCDSKYGRSKLAGEEALIHYSSETGAAVFVYRFPNLVGKWGRPEYNSAVITFCHHIANDMAIRVDDPNMELELLFIDDLLEEFYDCLEGHPHRCEYPKAGEVVDGRIFDGVTPKETLDGRYCFCPVTHKATLGRIVELLTEYHSQPETLLLPSIPEGSFEKKLYSMYLSYLATSKMIVNVPVSMDERGGFAELFKSFYHGQFSINVLKPGKVKGQHWHNGKWEIFVVVSGHGLIQERKIGADEVIEFEVSGDKIQMVYCIPGYTHNIINLSETQDLVTLMYANEIFDSKHPETYHEDVCACCSRCLNRHFMEDDKKLEEK